MGEGHKKYEQVRSIEAAAVRERRSLTPKERATIDRLNCEQKQFYKAAFQRGQEGHHGAGKGDAPDLSGIRTKTRIFRSDTIYSGTNSAGLTSSKLMASSGHVTVQSPHPIHFSVFTMAVSPSPSSVMASK